METLENRYTLSGITAGAFDGIAELVEAAPPAHDQELRDSDSIQASVAAISVPEIDDFDAYVDSGDILCVSGRVFEDGSPVGAGRMVLIAWWGGQQPAMTAGDGKFYFTTEVEEHSEGYVSAVTWNEVGQSESVQVFVQNN